MGLDEDFQAAVDDISNKVAKTMTDDELKEIYALYKQVTHFHICYLPSFFNSPFPANRPPSAT